MNSSNPQTVSPGPNHTVTAHCPACNHRGSTILLSSSDSSGMGIFVMLLLCVSCACCLLADVKDNSLIHYCERCGLRLVTEANKGSKVQYDSSNLVSLPPGSEKSAFARSAPGARIASSPLGPPPPMDRASIVNINARYRNLRPFQILNIELARFKLPCKVTSRSDSSAVSYTIDSPGIPHVADGEKIDPQFLQKSCSWRFSGRSSLQAPHFRVNRLKPGTVKQEIAKLSIFGMSNWNAEVHVVDRNKQVADTGFAKLNKQLQYVTRHMYAEGEESWRTAGPGILWLSSQGLLLWSMRYVADADEAKGQMLCLLDAYDRLVVALQKMKKPEGGGKMFEMRVYAEVSEDFMGEILASFTAVRVQTERILQEHMFDPTD